jgi:hypothetical protein
LRSSPFLSSPLLSSTASLTRHRRPAACLQRFVRTLARTRVAPRHSTVQYKYCYCTVQYSTKSCIIQIANQWCGCERLLFCAACSELADLADLDIPQDDEPSQSDDMGHVWEKDASPEECGDCGTMVDTWCKHCEACKYCHDNGKCQPCQVGEEV